jgi:hypothetical protein
MVRKPRKSLRECTLTNSIRAYGKPRISRVTLRECTLTSGIRAFGQKPGKSLRKRTLTSGIRAYGKHGKSQGSHSGSAL